MIFNCSLCGKEFKRSPAAIKTEHPCCSRECSSSFVPRRPHVNKNLICPVCGKKFHRRPAWLKAKSHFCSSKCYGDHKRIPAEKRFWKHVNKLSKDECWEFIPHKPGKYGSFSINSKHISAHRFSYELHNGPIPDELWVLHKCDNPPCVNPNHLFLGTHQDNVDDMVKKGRNQRKPK